MTDPIAVCQVCGSRNDLEELTWEESTGIFAKDAECPDCTHDKFDIVRREEQWQ